ncbi:Fasciclin-like arabinogalactan protein 1 [Camellia lanceoleosa]|uniref:Fasciclin-like arabinogalactan protein 1 n=1 Tax=Camellia lanceoleosa TaxID=1840588 RepID=A0ACC0GSM1_9ERIC|nr:Fasciclin-like arabinogalactan protein 1 [Camellia lanceoleosa]
MASPPKATKTPLITRPDHQQHHSSRHMFQDTDMASSSSGFVNITDLRGGKVGFRAKDNGGNVDAIFVKSLDEVSYNIFVIQISKILISAQAEAPTPGPSQVNLTATMSSHGCKVFAETLQTSDAEKMFQITHHRLHHS